MATAIPTKPATSMHEHQGGQKASKHHGEGSPHAIPMIAKYTQEGVSIGKVWLA
jgi:hypothetical protein